MLIEQWVPEGKQQALWNHTNRLRVGRSGKKMAFEQGDQDDRVALRARSVRRHSRIPVDVQRPGTRTASATTRARVGSSTSSDDDYESATLDFEEKGAVLLQKNFAKDNDQPTKEADEEIIKRYLARYTSTHDVEVKSPSQADGGPGITHTETVADAPKITGQVVDEPRTSIVELPTSVAGTEVLEDEKTRPLGRRESISLVVEPVPRRGSVSPSVVEPSSHGGSVSSPAFERPSLEGSVAQLPPDTFILES